MFFHKQKVDTFCVIVYNVFMKKMTSKEIYNYLNLTNRRLGRLYRITGYNPLPDTFVFNQESIKERLYLNQMPSDISFPDFLYEDKKSLKKRFALSLKRIKQILKEKKYETKMTPEFTRKFESYLVLRREVTSLILKDFSKDSFDECDAYTEICSINTIFFDLLDEIFDDEFSFYDISFDLEYRYNIYYAERLKRLEKKNNEEISKKSTEINLNIQKNIQKNQKKEIKNEKILEKNTKNKEISNFKQEKMKN